MNTLSFPANRVRCLLSSVFLLGPVVCYYKRQTGVTAWATSDLTGHPWTKKRIPIGSMLTGAFVDRVIVLSTGSRRHMIQNNQVLQVHTCSFSFSFHFPTFSLVSFLLLFYSCLLGTYEEFQHYLTKFRREHFIIQTSVTVKDQTSHKTFIMQKRIS